MFCINCGKAVEDTWVKCPYCGSEIEKSEDLKGQNEEKDPTVSIGEEYRNETSNIEYKRKEDLDDTDKIKKRSFLKFFVLSFITCGIYGIYVLYGYVKDINKVCEGDGKASKNYIIVSLLTLVTFGIYGFYWYYTQGERLHKIAPKYGIQIREKGSTILLWVILGCTVIPGIGVMVATYIMFDNMNFIAKVYNGEVSDDEIANLSKPHPHLVRNVLITYGILFALMIASIAWSIKSLSTNDTSYDMEDTSPIVEDIAEDVENDYSEMDLEQIIGESEENLQEMGFEGDEELAEYTLLDGDVYVSCIDGKVDFIVLTGNEDNMPSIHGVKIGMNIEEADSHLLDIYVPAGKVDNQFIYINMDSGFCIGVKMEGESITEITIMQLSEEEVQEYAREVYIFPDSDKKYLSEDEVRSVEADKLAIGRNEIFARHGYIFEDETLKQHFESMPWYRGVVVADQFSGDSVFNDFEKKNVEVIKKVEDEINEQAIRATQEAEKQAVIDEAYNFVAGKEFHMVDSQISVEFTTEGDFVAIGYYATWPEVENKYTTYSFSAEYMENKDNWQYLTFVTIDGVEYYFRCFTNGSISLEGDGEFSGWYEPL